MDLSNKILNTLEKQVSQLYGTDPRLQQIQMALDIGDFLVNSEKNYLFVEAPVGTGKTLGSLIPTLLYGINQHKEVVYATATRSLQSQIFYKDSQILNKLSLLNKENTLLAMGMSNYACLKAFYDNKEKFTDFKRYQEIDNALSNTRTGLRRDIDKLLSFPLTNDEWDNLSLDKSKDCNLLKCPGHMMRKQFKKEHRLLVTNHAQIIPSQLNSEEGYGTIIPIHKGILIIDEAHLFLENFAGCVQQELPLKELSKLKHDLKLKKIFKNIDKIFYEIKQIRDDPHIGKRARPRVSNNVIQNLKIIHNEIIKQTKMSAFANGRDIVTDNLYQVVDNKIFAIINTKKNFSSLVLEKNMITTLPFSFYNDFGNFVKKLSKNNKIIFLSGTLTIENSPEDEIERNYNIPKQDFIYKKYTSPFEVGKKTYLVVPENIASPNNKNREPHIQDVVNIIKKVSHEISGGILVLNTSLDDMENIATKLKKSKLNRKIFVQGDKDTSQLSEDFRQNKTSILVASGSYSSGFSAPGDTLQTVVLTSLPFPVPDDPFYQIQKHEFKDIKDSQIRLTMMLKKLEQEMGRLIRTFRDYGMIIICDPRIWDDRNSYASKVRTYLKQRGYVIHSKFENIPNELARVQESKVNQTTYARAKLQIPIVKTSELFDEYEKLAKRKVRSVKYNRNVQSEGLKTLVREARKKVKELNRNRTLKTKIKLQGINKVRTNEQLAQLLVNIDYKYGLNIKEDLLSIFPPDEAKKYMLLEPDGDISGPVRVEHI